jgi:hypothetical protein
MAYFPHAFQKVLIGNGTLVASASKATTNLLSAGELAFADVKGSVITTPAVSSHPMVILAQGSFQADKIGPFHGGYGESVKSKGINPRYVSKFYKIGAQAAANHIIQIGWDGVSDATQPSFECGKTYNLRLDVKGSPALRFLSHNLYRTFSAYTGCCANDCSAGCTGDPVDPIAVMVDWAKQINADPHFKNFVVASVVTADGADGGTAPDAVNLDTYVPVTNPASIGALRGGLVLTAAYVDTVFGNCSFEPMDHVELQPLQIYASLVDDAGNPCGTQIMSVVEKQAIAQAVGIGETVIREYILSQSYGTALDYKRDPRLREVLDGNSVFTAVNRAGSYDRYCILHNVPRFSNPTSTFDNDQYLITIAVPAGTNMSAFVSKVESYLSGAGNPITLSDLS